MKKVSKRFVIGIGLVLILLAGLAYAHVGDPEDPHPKFIKKSAQVRSHFNRKMK